MTERGFELGAATLVSERKRSSCFDLEQPIPRADGTQLGRVWVPKKAIHRDTAPREMGQHGRLVVKAWWAAAVQIPPRKE